VARGKNATHRAATVSLVYPKRLSELVRANGYVLVFGILASRFDLIPTGSVWDDQKARYILYQERGVL